MHTHTHTHIPTVSDVGVLTTAPLDNSAVMNHTRKPVSKPPSWLNLEQVTTCKPAIKARAHQPQKERACNCKK